MWTGNFETRILAVLKAALSQCLACPLLCLQLLTPMQTARVLLGSPYVPDSVQLCRWLCAGASDGAVPIEAAAGDALSLAALYNSDDDFDVALAKLF